MATSRYVGKLVLTNDEPDVPIRVATIPRSRFVMTAAIW